MAGNRRFASLARLEMASLYGLVVVPMGQRSPTRDPRQRGTLCRPIQSS